MYHRFRALPHCNYSYFGSGHARLILKSLLALLLGFLRNIVQVLILRQDAAELDAVFVAQIAATNAARVLEAIRSDPAIVRLVS